MIDKEIARKSSAIRETISDIDKALAPDMMAEMMSGLIEQASDLYNEFLQKVEAKTEQDYGVLFHGEEPHFSSSWEKKQIETLKMAAIVAIGVCGQENSGHRPILMFLGKNETTARMRALFLGMAIEKMGGEK